MPLNDATPIQSLAAAIGLLGDDGSLRSDFFQDPIAHIRACLVKASQRKQLLQAIDALLAQDAALAATTDQGARAYPLFQQGTCSLALTLLAGTDAAVETTLGLAVEAVIDDASGATVAMDLPLLHAQADTLAAVTGTPGGPVRVRLAYPLPETGRVAVEASVSTAGGSFALHLTGLVVSGVTLPDLELRSDNVSGDLVTLVLRLLGAAAQVLTGDASVAAALQHLGGVLGLDPALPPLPLADLMRTSGTLSAWIAAMAANDAAALQVWLGHIAGLGGLSLTGAVGQRPSADSPWQIVILDGAPAVALLVSLDKAPDGNDVLALSAALTVNGAAGIRASVLLGLDFLRLNLGHPDAVTWFSALRAEVTCPALDDPAPLLAVQGQFGLGRIAAGLHIDADGVRPSLVLENVDVEQVHHPRIDLSSADSLSAAASTALSDGIEALIGSTGWAEELLLLLGLRPIAGAAPLQLDLLATDPLRALAKYHRGLLEGGGWSEPLSALARLLGVAAPAVDASTPGTWSVAIQATEAVAFDVLASAVADGDDLILELAVKVVIQPVPAPGGTPSAALSLSATASLLRLRIAADFTPAVIGMDGIVLEMATGPLGTDTFGIDALRLLASWSASGVAGVTLEVDGLSLALPGDADPSEPLTLDTLGVTWTDDASGAWTLGENGLDGDTRAALCEWAIRQLTRGGDPLWSGLLDTLAAPMAGDLVRVNGWENWLERWPEALRATLADAVARDGAGLLGALFGGDGFSALPGFGSTTAPWLWAVDGARPDVGLAAWLAADDGPAQAQATLAGDDDDQQAVIDWLQALGQSDDALGVTLAAQDVALLASGLQALDDWVAGSDGLWTSDLATPDPALNQVVASTPAPADDEDDSAAATPVTPVTAVSPFSDPQAVAAVAAFLAPSLAAGAVPVFVSPMWWPARAWVDLLEAMDATQSWQWFDLAQDPLGRIAAIDVFAGYVVRSAGDPALGTDADLAAALDRIAALAGPTVIVAAATAVAPVAAWIAARAAAGHADVTGLAAVAAPVGTSAGDSAALLDPTLADAIRLADTVFHQAGAASDDALWPHAALARAWREVVDGQAAPIATRTPGSGVLGASALQASASAALAALPAACPVLVVSVAGGTGLLSALQACLATGGGPGAADAAVVALVAPPELPAASGDLRAQAFQAIELGTLAFAPGPDSADALRWRLRLDLRSATGWLVGPPSANVPIAVRSAWIELSAALDGSSVASADVVLVDVTSAGVNVPACRHGDPLFGPALGAALQAWAAAAHAGDAHAAAVVALLRDDLGILAEANGVANVDSNALDQLIAQPGAWLATQAVAALSTGSLLGLQRGAAATGASHWSAQPAAGLRVDVDQASTGEWTVTVSAPQPGLPLAGVGRLAFTVQGGSDVPVSRRWQLSIPGVDLTGDPAQVALTVGQDPPLRLWPLDDPAALATALEKLPPRLATAIGAGLFSAVVEAVAGSAPSAGSLLAWVDDPWAAFTRALATGDLARRALSAIAGWTGVGLAADGRLPLIPGMLELGVDTPAAGARLVLGTPANGWAPTDGITLTLATGLTLTPDARLLPDGALALGVELPAAAAAAWRSMTLAVALDTQGLRIDVTPDPGPGIEIHPQFSGLGAFVDATAQRLIPMVLDRLLAALPAAGPLQQDVVALASAAGLYGTSFSDAPVAWRDLSVSTLMARADAIVPAVAQVVASACGISLGGTGTLQVTSTASVLALHMAGPAGSTLSAGLTLDPPGLTLGLAGLAAGPLLLDVSAQGQLHAGVPAFEGDLQLALDLADLLRIDPGPRLDASLDSTGTFKARFLPLGTTASASDAEIVLAPTPAINISAAGREQLALRWLVAPGIEILVQALGSALDTPLFDGGNPPTLRTLFTGAGLIADGHVVVPLPAPLDMLVGAAGSLASQVTLPLGDDLTLALVADSTRVGLALRGAWPFDLGDFITTLTFGSAGAGGLEAIVLQSDQGQWQFLPELDFAQIGVDLTKSGGLIPDGPVTLGDVGVSVGFDVALKPATGTLTVSPLTGAIRLGDFGLPALTGDGGNGVAASLMQGAGSKGAPINPALTLTVGWDGANLAVSFGAGAPGEPLWIDVGRTFGPLHIERIGLESGSDSFSSGGNSVTSAYVGVAVDGGIVAGPLSIAVEALALRVPLRLADQPGSWQIGLDGLTVDFQSSSITIAGGLLKAQITDGNGKTAYEYRGMLEVLAFGIGATALGAYAQMPKAGGGTYASLFLFVAIQAPIGGPPYLFITGLAGGFGWNRDFLPPSRADAVGTFPLVAVMGTSDIPPAQILQNMGPSLPPKEGALWLAVGVTFTTFELIATRALAYVKVVPPHFEIGLLGLMSAPLPSADYAIGQVELGLRAVYSDIDQVLSVQAQLTSNSWLFDHDCRLTGGFAFVVWFTRPQVVLSVGGYGPLFTPPAYYPQVAPVGFQWRFSSDIVIKGESYFALLPEAIMTGGRLEVSASGDWGSGSIVMYADAILWFHPPHFVLKAGFRITGKAFGFGFDVGAELTLTLPPIHVHVHVDFMWGFDFEFGEKLDPPAFLTLAQFLANHVDRAGKLYALRMLQGNASGSQAQTPDGTSLLPFLLLPEFSVEVTSKLPARTLTVPGHFNQSVSESLYAVPMGASLALDPTLTIAVDRQRADGSFEPLPAAQLAALQYSLVDGGVPAAIWVGAPMTGMNANSRPPVPSGADMRRMPAGLQLTAPAAIASTAGLQAIAVGALVDENPPQALPIAGAAIAAPGPFVRIVPIRARRRVAVDTSLALAHTPVPVTVLPRLAWIRSGSPLAAVAARATPRTASAPGRAGDVQWWELAHHQAAAHLRSDLPARVIAFNLLGEVMLDEPGHTGSLVLPTGTAAVAVVIANDADARAHRLGWDLSTPLHALSASTFLASGVTLQFPSPVYLPPAAKSAGLVPASLVVFQTRSLSTRLAARAGQTLVVALDALRTQAQLAQATLAVSGGRLGPPTVVGDAQRGRVHLVYTILERGAPTLDVALHTEADSWAVAGVLATDEPRRALLARCRLDAWADLWTPPPRSKSPLARTGTDEPAHPRATHVTFTLPG